MLCRVRAAYAILHVDEASFLVHCEASAFRLRPRLCVHGATMSDELNEMENFGKRPMGDFSGSSLPPPQKRPRAAVDASQQAAALLAAAEKEAEGLDVDALDANSLKRLILHVEKQINSNTQMRMKYADQPERFMDSELELYQSLKGLHAVAASPELYGTFA